MRKKLVSLITILCLCACTMITTPVFAYDYTGFNQKVSQLQNEYPNGTAWSNANTYPGGWYGCWAFANLLADRIFGTATPRNSWTTTSAGAIVPGDIITTDKWNGSGWNYGHTMFVIGVNGDTLTLAEGNYSGKIKWGRTLGRYAESFIVYHATNYDSVIGSAPAPANISVNFSPWDNGNFTYVRETDASIGQEINVSGGTCTDTGMYLYDANGNLLAKAANGSYYYRIYFKINEELGYTLTSGTVYKYKFYAIVNGQTYWSNEYSFKTSGTAPTSVSTDVSGACGVEEGTYTLTPACATGSRLDIANASTDSGANVQLHSANGTIAQEFIIESVGKPYYKIVAKCSGMVLDVQGALTDSGTNVFQHPYHGGSNEQWIFVDAGDGYYYIRPANNTNLSLDVWNGDSADRTNIWVYNSNQSNAQKWKLNKVVTDTENPVISNVKITDVTKDGYTVSCTATDNVGVTKVEFPTWTLNAASDGSDQDDLIWHLGVQNGNTYSYRVKTSEHNNETNIEYRTHIYAWDDAGNKASIAAEDVYIGVKSELTDDQSKEQVKPTETIEPIETVEPKETEKPTVDTKKYTFRFPRTNVYHQDQFDDVKANQWFSQSVADAFEMGLVKGVSNTEFNPYGDVTVAEAVTMAARIHSIYKAGNENFTPGGGMWYQVYLDYAYDSGIISRAYYNSDVSQKATRAQFAEIFANAMDDKGLYEINTVKDNAIPDVKMTAQYADDVYKLYRAGILAGNDVLGTFSPDTYITRAEVSAILARMSDTSNRLTFTMK